MVTEVAEDLCDINYKQRTYRSGPIENQYSKFNNRVSMLNISRCA